MEKYRTSSHSRFDLKYHFVWITKYRKPILAGVGALNGTITSPDPINQPLLRRLSLPISQNITLNLGTTILHGTASGLLVATAIVPEPSSLMIAAIGFLLDWMHQVWSESQTIENQRRLVDPFYEKDHSLARRQRGARLEPATQDSMVARRVGIIMRRASIMIIVKRTGRSESLTLRTCLLPSRFQR